MSTPDGMRKAIDAIGGSSPRGSSVASRASSATWASPKTWRTRPSSSRSSWPAAGIPENPGAWLMATAKNRAIDQLRRRQLLERKHRELGAEDPPIAQDLEDVVDADVGDDLLRLVLIACHPILSTEARVALTLRLLGGLTTEEIARAFLVPEPTIAQRIVRAKRTLTEARVPFEVPRGAALTDRLGSVLEVVYLVFNEGYSPRRATTGSGRSFARTRCGWDASSPSSSPARPRSTAS